MRKIDNIEIGLDSSTTKVIEYDFKKHDSYLENIVDQYFLEVEWAEIIKESRHNQVLQDAIDRVKIIYHLSKQNEQRDRP